MAHGGIFVVRGNIQMCNSGCLVAEVQTGIAVIFYNKCKQLWNMLVWAGQWIGVYMTVVYYCCHFSWRIVNVGPCITALSVPHVTSPRKTSSKDTLEAVSGERQGEVSAGFAITLGHTKSWVWAACSAEKKTRHIWLTRSPILTLKMSHIYKMCVH